MPDLVTHTTAAWACGRAFLPRPTLLLVLLGAQLPDLATRVPMLVLDRAEARWLLPLHTPVGLLLLSLLIAQLFTRSSRRVAFAALVGGGVTHLLLDAMQWNLRGSYHWLFPFSLWNGQLGWFSIEAAVPTVPLQLAGLVGVEFMLRRRRRPA